MALRDVRGHEAQSAQIRAALLGDRPGHAYLFAGPDGVGKAFFALQVAKLLLCADVRDGDACDLCKACRQAEHDNHPDLHRVEAPEGKREIRIEQIRGVCKQYVLRPHGERRIAVIRDADRMRVEAANALLKTLEEPPVWGTLLLTTARAEALPETIVSRCQVLRFAPLSRQDVAEILARNPEWPPEAVRFATNLGDGSVGRARDLLAAGGLELRDHWIDRLRTLRSQDNFELTIEILGGLYGTRRPLEEVRVDLRLIIQLILRYFRDVWHVQLGATGTRLFHADRAGDVRADAERLPRAKVESAIGLLITGWQHVNRNANLRVLLEHLFFRLGLLFE